MNSFKNTNAIKFNNNLVDLIKFILVGYFSLSLIYVFKSELNRTLIIIWVGFLLLFYTTYFLCKIKPLKFSKFNILEIRWYWPIIFISVVLSLFAFDRGYNFFLNDWESTRADGGAASSLAYILLMIVLSAVLNSNLKPLYILFLSFIMVLIALKIGARIMLICIFLQFFLTRKSKYSIIKFFLISVLVVMIAFVARMLRGWDFTFFEDSALVTLDIIFAGELDIFSYANDVSYFMNQGAEFSNSLYFNLLTPFLSFRKEILGLPMQNQLWIFNYIENNYLLAESTTNKYFYEVESFGSHHPTFVWEYIGSSSIMSIIGGFLLPYITIIMTIYIFNYFKINGRFVLLSLVMYLLFYIRGNSVTATTQLFLVVFICLLINTCFRIVKK